MNSSKPVTIEMFYTLTCPNCKILNRMLDEVLPEFEGKFQFKKSMANSPIGMIKTMKLGINSVPTLLINNEIVFKGAPTKQELINKLKMY
ncbi:MAG: thioredoxin family protein [Paludibacter sp.]|nr:thioredoxin family protein [Paludibacter sp.]